MDYWVHRETPEDGETKICAACGRVKAPAASLSTGTLESLPSLFSHEKFLCREHAVGLVENDVLSDADIAARAGSG